MDSMGPFNKNLHLHYSSIFILRLDNITVILVHRLIAHKWDGLQLTPEFYIFSQISTAE